MSRDIDLSGYVDVNERIRRFYERYPEGSLSEAREPQFLNFAGKHWIVYSALAYRTPGDVCPGQGSAWEQVPGRTPYTRDSELMNAETSAWGRAIAALGLAGETIATRQDVEARQGNDEPEPPPAEADEAQRARLRILRKEKGEGIYEAAFRATIQPGERLTRDAAETIINVLSTAPNHFAIPDAVVFAGASDVVESTDGDVE